MKLIDIKSKHDIYLQSQQCRRARSSIIINPINGSSTITNEVIAHSVNHDLYYYLKQNTLICQSLVDALVIMDDI